MLKKVAELRFDKSSAFPLSCGISRQLWAILCYSPQGFGTRSSSRRRNWTCTSRWLQSSEAPLQRSVHYSLLFSSIFLFIFFCKCRFPVSPPAQTWRAAPFRQAINPRETTSLLSVASVANPSHPPTRTLPWWWEHAGKRSQSLS